MGMFDDAKVGDKVWSSLYGWGTVVRKDLTLEEYPLQVRFDNEVRSYTLGGYMMTNHRSPSLFWKEQKFDLSQPEPKSFWIVGSSHTRYAIYNSVKRTPTEMEQIMKDYGFTWKIEIPGTRE